METIKEYYHLTKPGIIYGNTLTVIAGFLFSSGGQVAFGRFLAAVAGTALVIASACACNNYIDRGIDKKMARTKKRALVTGVIPERHALGLSAGLGIIGIGILLVATTPLAAVLALIAWLMYVVVYGVAKRQTVHGTLVGSVSGALPVVIGYAANTGEIGRSAFLIFLIMAFWQMPHFYAIALFRRNDYTAAGLPVLPVKKPFRITNIHIVGYIAAFMLVNLLLFAEGFAGLTYGITMTALGIIWLWRGVQGFYAKNETVWAKSMFSFSMITVLGFSIMLSLNSWLP